VDQLYAGDNFNVLREHLADESVALIHHAPPFNSKRYYHLLFKSPVRGKVDRPALRGDEGSQREPSHRWPDNSSAQITAFEDSWHWGEQAGREFDELTPNTNVSEMMQALRRFLGENDMMAYLTMMANRLLQLHRVLKPTGSLYLHCDPNGKHFYCLMIGPRVEKRQT